MDEVTTEKGLTYAKLIQVTEGANKIHPEIILMLEGEDSSSILTQHTHNMKLELIKQLVWKDFLILKCSDRDDICFGLNNRLNNKIIDFNKIDTTDDRFIDSYKDAHLFHSLNNLSSFDKESEIVKKLKDCATDKRVKDVICYIYDIPQDKIGSDDDLYLRIATLGFAENDIIKAEIIPNTEEAIKKAIEKEYYQKIIIDDIGSILNKNSDNNKFKLIMKESNFNQTALDKDINSYDNNEE